MKKNKRIKERKYVSEDTKQIRSLIIITLGIILFALGIYFLTDAITKKTTTLAEAEFDYSVCTVGMMFNRPEKEYYVFLYSDTDENATYYKSLVSKYITGEDATKIYTVNLNANLDDKYLNDVSNTSPKNPSEVKIKDSALVLIKDGKVINYYETVTNYEKVLN